MRVHVGHSFQLQGDFSMGRDQQIVYNPRLDLIGLLTFNRNVPQGFIVLNLDIEEYGRDGMSDAIVWTPNESKNWIFLENF